MSPTTEIPGPIVAPTAPRCRGTTLAGEPCGYVVGPDAVDGLCPHHTPDPDRRAAIREAQARGGQASRDGYLDEIAALREELAHAAPALELTLDGVARYQKWAIEETVAGRMAPGMLSKLSYALTGLRTVLLGRDVEQRIAAALEQWERFKREHPA